MGICANCGHSVAYHSMASGACDATGCDCQHFTMDNTPSTGAPSDMPADVRYGEVMG